jgi:hypothetical protein
MCSVTVGTGQFFSFFVIQGSLVFVVEMMAGSAPSFLQGLHVGFVRKPYRRTLEFPKDILMP